MNLKKIITGIALAAGLLSSGMQSQAGIVSGNYLYSPITIKMSYTLNGHKYKVTNKEILSELGYPASTKLAWLGGDVYAINQNNVILENLTYWGYLYADYSEYDYNEYYKANGTYVYQSWGYLYIGDYALDNTNPFA